MIRLITPIGMLITVAVLSLFAAFGLWSAYAEASWLYAALGALALIACYGAAMLRSWSKYLVYVLTASFTAVWCYSVYAGASVGYYDIFFASRLDAARSLAPGLAMIALLFVASWCTYAHFRRAVAGTGTPDVVVPQN